MNLTHVVVCCGIVICCVQLNSVLLDLLFFYVVNNDLIMDRENCVVRFVLFLLLLLIVLIWNLVWRLAERFDNYALVLQSTLCFFWHWLSHTWGIKSQIVVRYLIRSLSGLFCALSHALWIISCLLRVVNIFVVIRFVGRCSGLCSGRFSQICVLRVLFSRGFWGNRFSPAKILLRSSAFFSLRPCRFTSMNYLLSDWDITLISGLYLPLGRFSHF